MDNFGKRIAENTIQTAGLKHVLSLREDAMGTLRKCKITLKNKGTLTFTAEPLDESPDLFMLTAHIARPMYACDFVISDWAAHELSNLLNIEADDGQI